MNVMELLMQRQVVMKTSIPQHREFQALEEQAFYVTLGTLISVLGCKDTFPEQEVELLTISDTPSGKNYKIPTSFAVSRYHSLSTHVKKIPKSFITKVASPENDAQN